MVYNTLTDRLGNLLFQIAAGASLAHRNNSEYLACISDFSLPDGTKLKDYLKQFEDNILRKIKFYDGIPKDSIEYVQPGFHYTPITYFDKIRLTGYFQSEKFFDREYVRNLYSIDEKTLAYIKNKYAEVLKGEIISINIRRGDYLKRPHRQPICCMPYFQNAIGYLGKNKRYLVISDDIKWCKQKFTGDNFYFSDYETPLIDLYLQSMCTHNVISNSTFGWWGAWLNPNPSKVIIAPKDWFGKQIVGDWDLKDLIPTEWVRLENPKTVSLKIKAILYGYL